MSLNQHDRSTIKYNLRQKPLRAKNIRLRLVEAEDAQFILSLRLDPNKNKFLSEVSPDLQKQIDYINSTYERDDQFYFIIETHEGRKLGTVRLYDLKSDSFCWGSWLIVSDRPSGTAMQSALTIYEFGFYALGFKKVHFDVRIGNDSVIAFHTRMGAVETHRDELDIFFHYDIETYERMKKEHYASYFSET